MSCFVIAEAGVNHNGDLSLAKELIHAAKETGADAVKFQTFKADNLVNKKAEKAHYQKRNTGDGNQYEMLKNLELSLDDHYLLNDLAHSLNIEFMSTGFDEESVDFLISLGVKRLKVPSGEITNIPLLQQMAKSRLPLIISTGMCYLSEVEEALQHVLPFYDNPEKYITLLHCTSNYPAAFEEVNLRAMQTLHRSFNLPVGYSDHTLGILVSVLAVAMEAKVIEKHFTLDKNLAGPDHAASLSTAEFTEMVKQIREAETCLGKNAKEPGENELAVRELVRRSISLKHDLPKNSILTSNDLILLRPGTGIMPKEIEKIFGKRLKVDLEKGSTLLWDHLEQ